VTTVSSEPLDDVPTLARLLRISPRSVYNFVKAGTIPYYRVNGQLRFDRAEVLATMRGQAR
jgi:excisionase family DNA binding protein